MNERLEQALIAWHKDHFKKSGTFEQHSGFYLENSSQLDLARYFYNLALEDVKKELGKMIIEAPVSAEGHQRVYAYNSVMDFINNQKQ